ncbi:PREDICTED: ABC transporter C family member 13-like, partial [Nelumbo nucifera]|uniref:ABC transporter C family member 13-like n=1 Tax=Nelumbo nucifera TaxID=4432 RepID=A0A1U8AZN7_NELNU
MEFMKLVCPKSPIVWDGNGFSECFENMVLGFCANAVTVVMIVVLGFTGRNARRSSRITEMCFVEKLFLTFIPAFGALLSFCDMVFLLKKVLQGKHTIYHEWFFRCSQLLTWATIILFSKCENWFFIFCDRVLCFWWIARPLFGIPHLHTVFSSLEVIQCLKESCSMVIDIIFGLFVNIIRVMQSSYKSRNCGSLEENLISSALDSEEGHLRHFETIHNYWHLLTFKSISPVMDRGVTKQLDFEDLVQLPTELNPSSCHSTLRSCWVAEQCKNSSQPSLFKAICCAYGWPYFRLGLLKVLNDCIGFVGPLLLNKLIWFLQKGA